MYFILFILLLEGLFWGVAEGHYLINPEIVKTLDQKWANFQVLGPYWQLKQ
jgi:hypothetical protein